MAKLIRSIDGVLISTTDLSRQRELFEGLFGLREVAQQLLRPAQVKALWGVSGHVARTVLLQTPGTRVGVRLLELDPRPMTAIREGASGVDVDALKVIDFLTEDLESGAALAARRRFTVGDRANYSVADGRFTEGHLQGPDGVFCAMLQSHDAPWSQFVRVDGRRFSEILGFSAPVADPKPVAAFYRALGLTVVYRYKIANKSFDALLGADRKTRIRGWNYGLSQLDPMIGIVHYGLPEDAYDSLRERSVLPNRGIAGICLTVTSIDKVEAACQRGGWEITADPTEAELLPYGQVRTLAVRAPHGVVHHCIERLGGHPAR